MRIFLTIILTLATVGTATATDFAKVPNSSNPNLCLKHPTLSPDGFNMAYVEFYISQPDIPQYSLTFADLGAGVPDFGPGWGLLYPSWSPDGQEIAAVSHWDQGRAAIMILSTDTNVEPRLIVEDGRFERPAWSVDGNLIVFGGPNESLHMVAANGGTPFPLPYSGRLPAWGLGGLAYVHDGDIWVADNDGQRSITPGPASDTWPSWSNDGQWLVFSSNRSGNWDLWVVARTGGTPIQLTTHQGKDSEPSWSTDNQTITFMSDRDGILEIWKAVNLPDFTVSVDHATWSEIKGKYR